MNLCCAPCYDDTAGGKALAWGLGALAAAISVCFWLLAAGELLRPSPARCIIPPRLTYIEGFDLHTPPVSQLSGGNSSTTLLQQAASLCCAQIKQLAVWPRGISEGYKPAR